MDRFTATENIEQLELGLMGFEASADILGLVRRRVFNATVVAEAFIALVLLAYSRMSR